MDPKSWLTLIAANSLTLGRLLVGLAFPWIAVAWRPIVFLVAAASDAVDGAISRRFHGTSTAGQLLDPIADKIFVLMVVGTLWSDGALPLWQIALIALREWAVLFIVLWLLLARNWRGLFAMIPSWTGKVATAAQFVFLLAALWGSAYQFALFIVAAIISGIAAAHYLLIAVKNRRPATPQGQ